MRRFLMSILNTLPFRAFISTIQSTKYFLPQGFVATFKSLVIFVSEEKTLFLCVFVFKFKAYSLNSTNTLFIVRLRLFYKRVTKNYISCEKPLLIG